MNTHNAPNVSSSHKSLTGQILWGANNIFQVSCTDGFERQCRLQGKILKQCNIEHNPLACGDWVTLRPLGNEKGLILSRIERQNAIRRCNLKRGEPQTFAANIDGIILLVSWSQPALHRLFLDRLLIAAQRSGCPILILLNKIDRIKTFKELYLLQQFLREYRKLGLKIWPISLLHLPDTSSTQKAGTQNKWTLSSLIFPPISLWSKIIRLDKTNNDWLAPFVQTWIYLVYINSVRKKLHQLYQCFADKLYVVLGASGVGKSTLCNYFFPEQLQAIGSISQKSQLGVHTTTLARTLQHRQGNHLYRLIDTPGMQNFLPDFSQEELPSLQSYYPEFTNLLPMCEYSDCQHYNEPNCAVREAVDYGFISAERYQSYVILHDDLERHFVDRSSYQNKENRETKETKENDLYYKKNSTVIPQKSHQKLRKTKLKNQRKNLHLDYDEEGNLEYLENY